MNEDSQQAEQARQTGQILKVDTAGRVWTPRARREAVLDEFERSGLPGTKFAGRIGVKYPTFAAWVQQRRRVREAAGASPTDKATVADGTSWKWVEASVESGGGAGALSVLLPGGARLEIADAAQARIAAELLRALALREGKAGVPC